MEKYSLLAGGRQIARRVVDRRGKVHETRLSLQLRVVAPVAQERLAALYDQQFLRLRRRPVTRRLQRCVRVADLFSGCGAMSLGVWEACRALRRSFLPVVAVDSDPDASRTYETFFPDLRHSYGDILDILDSPLGARVSTPERRFKKAIGRVDLVVGGPPCQGHSNLNNHTRRRDPKNRLYDRMARFAEVVRPSHMIIENVPAVLQDRRNVVRETIATLRSLGYRVSDEIIDIHSLGVAQLRRRHVIVASRYHNIDIASTMKSWNHRGRSIGWAIGDLNGPLDSPLDAPAQLTERNKRRIRYLFDNGLYDLPDSRRPKCHRDEYHSYKSVYGRLRWDQPAQTITSGFTCMGQGRYVHPRERRTLTPHEAARLQFIPDFVRFPSDVGRSALCEMIGNAVPPKLTYALAIELLR